MSDKSIYEIFREEYNKNNNLEIWIISYLNYKKPLLSNEYKNNHIKLIDDYKKIINQDIVIKSLSINSSGTIYEFNKDGFNMIYNPILYKIKLYGVISVMVLTTSSCLFIPEHVIKCISFFT